VRWRGDRRALRHRPRPGAAGVRAQARARDLVARIRGDDRRASRDARAAGRRGLMARPAAPQLRITRWDAGRWSDAPDAVVTEEPLQLSLDGAPLSVVMRTPGQDLELALGLFYAEGIARTLGDIKTVRVSAETQETAVEVEVDASMVESNQVDIHLAQA